MSQASLWDSIKWNDQGLLPVIAQDAHSNDILMMAWMNKQALEQTIATLQAVYWSRSRQKLWCKGETSGHIQKIKSIHLDCDGDTLLLKVTQVGGIACHTGRANCFFRTLQGEYWEETQHVLKSPEDIYNQQASHHD
jgi:phosphoribosyl-AMP cyclohydrolase